MILVNVKREKIQRIRENLSANEQLVDESKIAENLNEQEILIQSIMESFVPRLISEGMFKTLCFLLKKIYNFYFFFRSSTLAKFVKRRISKC